MYQAGGVFGKSGPAVDPYGRAARERLAPHERQLQPRARTIARQLRDYLLANPTTARFLSRRDDEAVAELEDRFTASIERLVSAGLTRSAHRTGTADDGRVYALAGVDLSSLTEAHHYFDNALQDAVDACVAPAGDREAVMQILRQRLFLDLEYQVAYYKQFDDQIATLYGRLGKHINATENQADLVQGALAIIGELPGRVNAFFSRLDGRGQLEIEQSHGPDALRYYEVMQNGEVPQPRIDSSSALGRSPAGQAWRSGHLTILDTLQAASNAVPWRAISVELGFRSVIAVPLTDNAGHTVALLRVFNESPGFFSISNVYAFFTHVQTVLSHAILRMSHVSVIPLRDQRAYRALLTPGSVQMLYQPIIRLADGHMVKMEALARLRDETGQRIAPNRFLPAFGKDELFRLFELGLDQACADYHNLAQRGIRTAIAINCPAEGCGDPRYEQALSRILETHDVPRHALDFEVLETTDDTRTNEERSEFLRRLEASGVRIVQDDLGAGQSSLQRLDQHPFHEVKIDQFLVRGARREPRKTVEFIFNLTRLAHAFDIDVTVEGLEYDGLIEAAAILGADHGQGFAIAHPMTADELVTWHRTYAYTVQPTQPRTAFGALAAYLLWDMQLATIAGSPDQLSAFKGARALIEHFIDARQLAGGAIDSLVDKIRSLALDGHSGRKAQPMVAARRALISELSAYCFSENAEQS